ncbi:hypothetical protein IFM89_004715 [Coptis chinensis]|uniref:Uncharacterized protein n=1 Tax=Coptis chinensis TaxID=261450 RepID=A0A835LA41_9MAGN|nr:hypothetical protein IFM89_004715 [Coptis chinensis]
MEKDNLEKEKSVLMGTALTQDNQDGALEITVSGEKYRCLGFAKAKSEVLSVEKSDYVQPVYQCMLGCLRSRAFEHFKKGLENSFNEGEPFSRIGLRVYPNLACLNLIKESGDAAIQHAKWDPTKVREKLRRDMEAHAASFSTSLSGFELDQATYNGMALDLRQFTRSLVEKKAKEEAGKSLKILFVMAALRLEDKSDKIENVLFSSLMDGTVSVLGSQQSSVGISADPLASNTWAEVSPNDVLITPVQCKSLWRQFKTETEYTVTQAISSQVFTGTGAVVLATHNLKSRKVAAAKAQGLGIRKGSPKLQFDELKGMTNELLFGLRNAEFQVSKYFPYDPVEMVMPILSLKGEENVRPLSASTLDM